MNESAWILIGLVAGISIVFKILIMNLNGKFKRKDKK